MGLEVFRRFNRGPSLEPRRLGLNAVLPQVHENSYQYGILVKNIPICSNLRASLIAVAYEKPIDTVQVRELKVLL